MRLLPLGAIVLCGLVSGAAACNFIYESQLKDYSGECKFEGRQTACGQCIVANCTPQVNAVCLERYTSTLSSLEACAKDPNVNQTSSSYTPHYPCDDYATADGGVVEGDNRHNLAVCVRDACISPADGPCKPTCAVEGNVASCRDCINERCGARLVPVCTERGSGTVFYEATQCADGPEVYKSYCGDLVEPWDGGINEEGKEPATLRNNFRACVRDNCLSSEDAGCKTCPVTYIKDNAEPYDLFAQACGGCILEKCYPQFMACCANTEDCHDPWISAKLASCAFPELLEPGCQDMFNADAGAQLPLADCLRQNCKPDCKIPQ